VGCPPGKDHGDAAGRGQAHGRGAETRERGSLGKPAVGVVSALARDITFVDFVPRLVLFMLRRATCVTPLKA